MRFPVCRDDFSTIDAMARLIRDRLGDDEGNIPPEALEALLHALDASCGRMPVLASAGFQRL